MSFIDLCNRLFASDSRNVVKYEKRGVGGGKIGNSLKSRRARVEQLESRELLSVSPTEYAALQADYASFALPDSYDDVNIIEITSDNLKASSLRDAIAETAKTEKPDLIVVRTTLQNNIIDLATDSSQFEISAPTSTNGSVTIIAVGEKALTIDAAGRSRHFYVASGARLNIANLALTGGYSGTGGNGPSDGGSVYSDGSFYATNSLFYGNKAHNGGGAIYGSCALTNCTVAGNNANWGGGIDGTATLNNTIVAQNTARSNVSYNNIIGTITADSNNNLIDCNPCFRDADNYDFRLYATSPAIDAGNNGRAPQSTDALGNARRYNGGTVDIGAIEYQGERETASTITVTTPDDVYDVDDGVVSLREATAWCAPGMTIVFDESLKNQTILFNSQIRIYGETKIDGASLNLTFDAQDKSRHFYVDSYVSLNLNALKLTGGYAGDGNGGSVYSDGSFYATNSLFYGNKAGNCGGAIYGTCALINCTVACNTITINWGGGICGTATLNNTIVAQNTAGNASSNNIYGTITADSNNNLIDCNPCFRDADNYDFRLYATSPAIDAGNNDWVAVEKDMRGAKRIYDGRTVDIGCYEYEGERETPETITVTIAEDVYKISDGKISLREAAAWCAPGMTIVFDESLKNQTILFNSQIRIYGETKIDGSSLNLTFDAQDKSRHFYVDYYASLNLNALKLTGGYGGNGGSVYSDGSFYATNSLFYGNKADNRGGAIYGSCALINCTVAGNYASQRGGGIYGTATLNNTIVAQNTAGYASSNNIDGTVTGYNNIIDANPAFLDAEHNDFRLYKTSPAIDTGNNDLVAVEKDMRGTKRIYDGGTVDIGCYEYEGARSTQETIVVNTPKDGADGDDSQISLREAIAWAPSGTKIVFDKSLANSSVYVDSSIPVWGATVVVGEDKNVVVDGQGKVTIFDVTGTGASLDLSNIELTRAKSAIYVRDASKLKANCVKLRANGTGVENYGNATISNSLVSDNTNYGLYNGSGVLNVYESTVAGNKTGVYAGGRTVVYNSVVSGNTTNVNGTLTAQGYNVIGGDANFADPDYGNYRLKDETSPAYDGGETDYLTIETEDYDLDGLPRVVHGYLDCGCYEVQSRESLETPEIVSVARASGTIGSVTIKGVANAERYRIQVSELSTFASYKEFNCDVGQTNVVLTGLVAGKAYYVRARAVGDYISRSDSEWSNLAKLSATDITVPAAPTSLAYSNWNRSGKTLDLSWKDMSANESGFRVEKSTNGGKSWSLVKNVDPNVTSVQATGLSVDASTSFRVRSYNDAGESDWATLTFTPATVDLAFNQLEGWDDSIIVSTSSSATTSKTAFSPSQSVYLRFAYKSNEAIAKTVTQQVYVDGVLKKSYDVDGKKTDVVAGLNVKYTIGKLAAGEHTITVKLDGKDALEEKDESNNERSFTITVLEDDAYEPNDSLSKAVDLGTITKPQTYSDLVAGIYSNKDYYKFTLERASGADAYVELKYAHIVGEADVNLYIYDANGKLVKSSKGTTGTEKISLDGLAAGTYTIYAYNYRSVPSNVDYTLSIVPSAYADVDFYTPDGWKDSVILSTSSSATSSKTAYMTTQSVYARFAFKSNEALAETLVQEVYVDGNLIGTSKVDCKKSDVVSGINSKLTIGKLSAGEHTITVKLDATDDVRETNESNNERSFTISVWDDDAYEPNDSLTKAVDLGTIITQQTYSDLIAGVYSNKDYYQFTTIKPGTPESYVALDYAHVSGKADVNLYLYDANGSLITSSKKTTGAEKISLDGLAPGTYKIYAYNIKSVANPVDYSLTIAPPASADLAFYTPDGWSDSMILSTSSSATSSKTTYMTSQSVYARFAFNCTEALTETLVQEVYVDGALVGTSKVDCKKSDVVAGINSKLTIGKLSAGEHTITVKLDSTDVLWERDETNNERSMTITVLPDDGYEPNDSLAKAVDLGTIATPQTYSGLVAGVYANKDYYKFTLTNAGTPTSYVALDYAHVSGKADVNLYLYGADGKQIAKSTKTTGAEKISLDGLAAGTYTIYAYNIKSVASPVDYSLTIVPPATADLAFYAPNGWKDSMILSTSSSATSSKTTFSAAQNVYLRFAFNGNSELEDVFVQNVYVDGKLAKSYEADGLTDDLRAGLDFSCSLGKLSTGKHTISVKLDAENVVGELDETNNERSISITVLADDGYEPNDSLKKAADLGAILVPKTYSNLIAGVYANKDYYKFELVNDGTPDSYVELKYTHSSSKADVNLYLYNEAGKQIAKSTGATGTEKISLDGLEAGAYYVCAYNSKSVASNANYSLSFVPPAAADVAFYTPGGWGDSVIVATSTNVTKGKTTFSTSENVAVRFAFNATEPIDDLLVEEVYLDGELVEFYETDGLCDDVVSGLDFAYAFGKLAAGEHTITIKLDAENVVGETSESNNERSIKIKVVESKDDKYESNDSRAKAADLGTMESSKTVANLIAGMNGNQDWYKFTLTKPGTANSFIELYYAHDSKTADVNLYLYDAAGKVVAKSTGATGLEKVSLNNCAAGTYYVRAYNAKNVANDVEYSLYFSMENTSSAAPVAKSAVANRTAECFATFDWSEFEPESALDELDAFWNGAF